MITVKKHTDSSVVVFIIKISSSTNKLRNSGILIWPFVCYSFRVM